MRRSHSSKRGAAKTLTAMSGMLPSTKRAVGLTYAPIIPGQVSPARNEPCPCGSELKFKKCCLLRMRAIEAESKLVKARGL